MYLDWQKKSDVTNNSRLYDIIIEEYKKIILSIIMEFILESLLKKTNKKNP